MKERKTRYFFFENEKMNEFLLTRWKILNMYDADELYMLDRKIYSIIFSGIHLEKNDLIKTTREN